MIVYSWFILLALVVGSSVCQKFVVVAWIWLTFLHLVFRFTYLQQLRTTINHFPFTYLRKFPMAIGTALAAFVIFVENSPDWDQLRDWNAHNANTNVWTSSFQVPRVYILWSLIFCDSNLSNMEESHVVCFMALLEALVALRIKRLIFYQQLGFSFYPFFSWLLTYTIYYEVVIIMSWFSLLICYIVIIR